MKPGAKRDLTFPESARCACAGIVATFRKGRNIRIQTLAALIAIIGGIWLHISLTEWVVIVFCIGLVIGSECMNTSFEDVVDLACPHHDSLAGRAKDIAAGAVLIFSLMSLVIGLLIFIPRIVVLMGIW
ncbi:MAG: diacylglycerol kinase family protein [Eggerthellaceae bacterium]|jgi:diacylglycerol kinase|nr:diacylglycerol kinase family protein [Eggerthellaceae bacterium]MCH4221128.1 diacylglycerol kinase family protein [Eggerthellaceae bacterium]